MALKLDKMESDLVLACKLWYGEKGIEKVIADNVYGDIEHIKLDSKYHWISKLFMKLIDTGYFKLSTFINEISPRHIDGFGGMDEHLSAAEKVYRRMVSMICNLQVQDHDKEGNWYTLVELHEVNEKFREKEEEEEEVEVEVLTK